MECVRLINWCIEATREELIEKWLVRGETDRSYREIISEVHRPLLKKSSSVIAAIEAVSRSHNRPIPYHPMDIVINQEDGRIHSYKPKHNDWQDLTDITTLVSIAEEITLVTAIVKKQEQPTTVNMNKARNHVLGEKCFFRKGASKKTYHVAERLTFLTGVKPICLTVNEQHHGKISSQSLSAKETIFFLMGHASSANKEKRTLTIYRLHMNRAFAQTVLEVICREVLTSTAKPFWSKTDYVYMPNPFFRFVFIVDEADTDVCPIARLFLEQYFAFPCDTGVYNASCADNVAYIFSRMVPLEPEEQMSEEEDMNEEPISPAALVDCKGVDARKWTDDGSRIAVLDYTMFYPYVMCVTTQSPVYQSRVLHMTAARSIVPSLKKVYVKELGMVGLLRKPLYGRMRGLFLAILDTLIKSCKHVGIQVILTQTDSVTLRVPMSVMQANGGSLDQLASVLQQMVRAQYPDFTSELKLEREGNSMIVFGPNKHILYDAETIVHCTGMSSKTFCTAMSRTIEEATSNMTQACQLTCSSDPQSELQTFVSRTLRNHAQDKTNMACKSYSLPQHVFTYILHVQPGEDGMFTTMPNLYLVVPQYKADNASTMPTITSFHSYTKMAKVDTRQLHDKDIKAVLATVFTESMGMIRWKLIQNELIEYFVSETVTFLRGGRLV